jgi:Domain of Unknown Function (DUF1080)
MARLPTLTIALLFSAVAGFQYTGTASGQSSGDGWITLFDGKNLDQWKGEAGSNATWRIEDGSIAVEKMDKDPKAIVNLVSKQSFTNFELRAEFWVGDDANSGIYIRCTDPTKVNSKSAYEVNISTPAPMRVLAPARSSMWPRPQPCSSHIQRRSPPRCTVPHDFDRIRPSDGDREHPRDRKKLK